MRIDAYNQVSQIYQASQAVKTQKKSKVTGTDKVEISEFGKIYQTAKKAVDETSDVRQDKVDEFKAKIKSGTYDVSAENFADKLLEKYNTLY